MTSRFVISGNTTFGPATNDGTNYVYSFNGKTSTITADGLNTGDAAIFQMKIAGVTKNRIYSDNAGNLVFDDGSTQHAAKTSAGAWTLGPSGFSGSHTLQGRSIFGNGGSIGVGLIQARQNADVVAALLREEATGSNLEVLRFYDGAGTVCGTIAINADANTTTYNTSSDARLKVEIENFDALSLVSDMNPVKYERESNLGVKEYGFIAQELHSIFPQAVTVGGEDPYVEPWQVDYSKLTGVLVKAIQELKAEIDALKGSK